MTAVRPAKSRFTLRTAIALLAAVVALGLPQSALAAPQQPTNLTATALDHDTVSLTWSHPDPASVDHYHIISRRLGSGAGHLAQAGTSTTTSFVHDGLEPESTYIYRVKPVNSQGEEGRRSPRAEATTPAEETPASEPKPDPTPAQPQRSDDEGQDNIAHSSHQIWSASITTGTLSSLIGVWLARSPAVGSITDRNFDYDGTTYTFSHVRQSSAGGLQISMTAAFSQTALDNLTFNVGSSAFALADATTSDDQTLNWNAAGLSWTDGQTIALTMTAAAASSDATLSALAVNDGTSDITLTPGFASGTYTYAADVASTVDEVTLTATLNDDTAEITAVTLDGSAIADSGLTDGITVPSLVEGDNIIVVTVTAEDASTQAYTVTVTRTTPSTAVPAVITVPAANPIQDTSDNQTLALSNQAVTNSAPTSRSVAENTAAGVDIGLPVVATGSSGAVTYTLGGTDAASFDIVAATGQLQTKAALDYETKSGYEVTVTATDTDGSVITTVAIEVTNVIELTTFSGPTMVTFAENGATRVATFSYSSDEDRDGIQWLPGGVDRGLFSLDSPSGALRFLQAPDFENPLDVGPPGRGTNNSYELKLVAWARDSGPIFTDEVDVKVTVTDVDEAGALSLSSTRPALGAVLTAVLTDPDGVTAGTALWQWERSTGRNSWAVIDGAAAESYTPVAADTNTFLRVTATYADEHGTGKTVSEVPPNVVTGPLLTGLTAESDDSQAATARGLYPAFDPQTLHYGIGCSSTDTLVLTVSAAANARVAVAGVQAASAPMAVDVSEDSDVAIRVTDASGAGTTYFVHCLSNVFFDIETVTFPNTDAFEDLILFNREDYFRLMDRNGVPRLRLGFAGAARSPVRFHRVGADGAYRYGFRTGSAVYTILDEDFEVVADGVRTVAPLTRVNTHDFQILEDGNYLLMAYEPALRDFSDIDLPYLDGAAVSSVDVRGRGGPDRHARGACRLHLELLGQHGHRGLRATPLPRDALDRSRHEESRGRLCAYQRDARGRRRPRRLDAGLLEGAGHRRQTRRYPGGRALADGPHQPERRRMGGAGHRPAAAGLHQRSRRRVLRPAHGALPAQRQHLPLRQRRGVRDRSVDLRGVGARGV